MGSKAPDNWVDGDLLGAGVPDCSNDDLAFVGG
jgi:hypothetical protein